MQNYCNGLADLDAKNVLIPDVEERRNEVNNMIHSVENAREAVSIWRRRIADIDAGRASASANLSTANERWDHIRKQIEDLNH